MAQDLHNSGGASAPPTICQRLVARFPALEPWYDWGIMHCETMDDSTPYQRRFFELEWFGLALSFQIGRIRREEK